MNQLRHRMGYTLIEVLTVLGIIGILVSILMPAIQATREAARRTVCANNLRQIGLAFHSYHDNYTCFPHLAEANFSTTVGAGLLRYYSPHVRLLPYLGQDVLYSSINTNLDAPDPAVPVLTQGGNVANSTAFRASVALFLCPSDAVLLAAPGINNYRANFGVGPELFTSSEYPDSGNGFFSEPGPRRARDVVDGLSNTAAFSERLTGAGLPARFVPERDIAMFGSSRVWTADDFVSACTALASTPTPPHFSFAGRFWAFTGGAYTLYNHALPPNAEIPDCAKVGILPFPGVFTARSWHQGGVNVLMGDGNVRFVSENIDRTVWRSIGTRNGAEAVGAESF